nr:hypothetical protein [Trichoderma barbatum polymycovirus 1]
MADLTRLRTIPLDHGSDSATIGAVLYHLGSDPLKGSLHDSPSVSMSLKWLASAPAVLYGELVGRCGFTPEAFSSMLSRADDTVFAQAATIANSMVVTDLDWDRATRDDLVQRISIHGQGAHRPSAQTSAEYAALDALMDAGYPSIDAAVAAVSDLRRVVSNTFVHHTRQFARAMHAVSACFKFVDGTVRYVLTPWCMSRRDAIAYVAVRVADIRRRVIEQRIAARAPTVVSIAARHSLQALRDLTTPALALLTRYRYDSTAMAFVNSSGRVVESATSRVPHAAVAFAYVFSRGSGDPLIEQAKLRFDVANSLPNPQMSPAVTDYVDLAETPTDALFLATRVLAHARAEREASEWGERVNKGAMLGYIARGRTKHDRNTVACINRIQECVVLSASRGKVSNVLYVVEWGSKFDQASVLAAAAAAGIDLALDIGSSGIDVPGSNVYGMDEEPVRSFQLYLSSAKSRNLPRMPTVEYSASDGFITRMKRLYDSLGGASSHYELVFIGGGVTSQQSTTLGTCIDALAQITAASSTMPEVFISLATAEFILPPPCHHSLEVTGDEFLSDIRCDVECDQCEASYRGMTACEAVLMIPGVRLVKARAMFGHNLHFSVEWTPLDVDVLSDTMITIDSVVACNTLRNSHYDTPPPPATPGRDITSPD